MRPPSPAGPRRDVPESGPAEAAGPRAVRARRFGDAPSGTEAVTTTGGLTGGAAAAARLASTLDTSDPDTGDLGTQLVLEATIDAVTRALRALEHP